MAVSLKWYSDAALTQELPSPLVFLQDIDDILGPADALVYLGSPSSGAFEMAANPGVNSFILTIVDDLAGGGLQDVGAITLALTLGELDTNTPGAPLNLGVVTINGGIDGAVPVYIRVIDLGGVKANYSNLHIDLPEVIEFAG